MTIAAIIAEYNPFHNGHDYMIRKIREELKTDYIVAVMSGDFTQRGLPGVADKFLRAKMAVSCDVDAVFELPVRYATSSAEGFAQGAVSFFSALSCVDFLVFGSECGTLEDFTHAADLLEQEPEDFRQAVLQYQKEGHSYPKAFSMAINTGSQVTKLSSSLLTNPNNLLGLEYIKALKKTTPAIRPHTILRTGTGYHDTHSVFSQESDSLIASASAIRSMLESKTGTIASALPLMPEAAYRLFAEEYGKTAPISLDDFSSLLIYQLSRETKESLLDYVDMSEDLAERILKFCDAPVSFTELISSIKHKQYTYARINRVLLHVLLNIRKDVTLPDPVVPYARLLAMKRNASPLMKEIKNHTEIPVITKPADAKKLLSAEAYDLFREDIFAANLYCRKVSEKFGVPFTDDIRRSIVLE